MSEAVFAEIAVAIQSSCAYCKKIAMQIVV